MKGRASVCAPFQLQFTKRSVIDFNNFIINVCIFIQRIISRIRHMKNLHTFMITAAHIFFQMINKHFQ